MLKIKLSRLGKRSQPAYRIIVAEARSKRDGQYTDLLGTYSPLTDPPTVKLNQAKYDHWIKQGAQPTTTVANLYRQAVKSLPNTKTRSGKL
ncbi:30S ribosomal protein S16 [Microgenomates group bacterium RBG_16_45_19]|nr:MAG: 30S ribosomal protein S16 [Microgenomates group bacterium RBG_16_45_19]